ncbi:hypothetical protein HJG60_009592 [Phyllostomus discolor]|uniref:Uncharacterized protein n=1 Tax=Phyllostomus discolor TaxID=89673 RepID=A0A833YFW7_9CHIR|nr:hypothetical protein HJG60_009592 [Phyllostomus discolor]
MEERLEGSAGAKWPHGPCKGVETSPSAGGEAEGFAWGSHRVRCVFQDHRLQELGATEDGWKLRIEVCDDKDRNLPGVLVPWESGGKPRGTMRGSGFQDPPPESVPPLQGDSGASGPCTGSAGLRPLVAGGGPVLTRFPGPWPLLQRGEGEGGEPFHSTVRPALKKAWLDTQ